MKTLLLTLALLLASPFATLAGEQAVPNGISRIGAAPSTGAALPLDYSDINVAVVDTGVDVNHPDLNVVGGVDCSPVPQMQLPFSVHTMEVGGDFHPIAPHMGTPGWTDGFGHGTHVAGIIGARDNNLGVIGVAPNASIWSVRVLDSNGGGTQDSIVCGLNWIIEHHEKIDLVNMSLGGTLDVPVTSVVAPCGVKLPGKINEPMHEALCKIVDLGIPVVVAAGNGPLNTAYNFPAAYPITIAVSNFADFDGKPGGLGENTACPDYGGWDDELWTHQNNTPIKDATSSDGPDVDYAAPGTCVLSTLPTEFGSGYGYATGTSMASPTVAGVVARLLGDHPEFFDIAPTLRVKAIREALTKAAEPQTESFHDVDEYHEPIIHVVP